MEPSVIQKHVCGRCNDEWLTEAEYLAHVCPASGFAPTQADHQGPGFVKVQEAALQRGLETAQSNGNPDQVVRNETAIAQLRGDEPPAPEQPEITIL